MATIVKTVASSGADYSTWQAAEDSIGSNPTDNYELKAILAETMTVTGAVLTISFSNSNNILVTVHGDDVLLESGLPGHTLVSDATGGGATTSAHLSTTVVYRNLRIGRVAGSTSSAVIGATATANRHQFDRCEIYADGSSGRLAWHGASGNANSVSRYYRCRMWMKNAGDQSGLNVVDATGTGGTLTLENTSILLVDGTRQYLVAFSGVSASASAYNTVALSAGTVTACFNGSFSGNKNGSSDATAPGATNYQSVVASEYFASATTPDLHCISRAVNIDYAGDDRASAIGHSKDCDNQTVAVGGDGWVMGADYVYPAAPIVAAAPAPDASYRVGDAYSVSHGFTGTGTCTFDVVAGALPSGTSLTPETGVVAGILDMVESVSYTLRVTDAWGQTGTREFSTTVSSHVVPSVSEQRGLSLGLRLGL